MRCLLVVAVLSSLAGCIDQETETWSGAIEINGQEIRCAPGLAECPEFANADHLVLADFELRQDEFPGIGILIRDPTVPITIQNVSIEGFLDGVSMQGTPCPHCVVRLDGMVIDVKQTGIAGQVQGGRIEIERTAITTHWIGELTTTLQEPGVPREDDANAGRGVAVNGNGTSVSMHRVSITAVDGSVSDGVALRAPGIEEEMSFDAVDVSVSGYRVGIDALLADMEGQNIQVDCRSIGIHHRSLRLGLRDTSIDGCSNSAVKIQTPVSSFTNVSLTGSHAGLWVDGSGTLEMENFETSRNAYGIHLGNVSYNPNNLALRNGVVRDNAFLGVGSIWATVDVEGVEFEGNGFGAPDPEPPHARQAYGGFASYEESTVAYQVRSIQDSSFVGNEPVGLWIEGTTQLPFDATQNWWGSLQGPSVALSAGEDPVVPGGDVVVGPAIVEPHAMSPP